ncbi:MAG: hypothetical protein JWO70_3078 [Betaproteobacteria bacterium]|nr:hypothetical protein [Betaproteobacteria bacterium]
MEKRKFRVGSTSRDASRDPSYTLAAILCACLFAFAFVAAPKSCEWGLSAYFWSGVATVLALAVTPFVLPRERQASGRGLRSFALAGLGCATWIGGLFAANVRIMCRLF